jgi:hypothetical protein
MLRPQVLEAEKSPGQVVESRRAAKPGRAAVATAAGAPVGTGTTVEVMRSSRSFPRSASMNSPQLA